jgi:salicylate hydroxylase
MEGVEDAEWLRQLRTLYAAERLPAATIAATTRLHRPTVNHVLDPIQTWHDQRTVLVGDAAHPVGAGQGASMSIEDGLALAAALASARSIFEGLDEYERLRRPRITRMQKAADDNREVKAAGPIKRKVEELVMPIVFRHFYEKMTAWLYTYQPQTPAPGSQRSQGER